MPDPPRPSHLQAIHEQRVEWMKTRAAPPLPGIYQDIRAVKFSDRVTRQIIEAARSAGVNVLFSADAVAQIRDGIVVAPPPEALPVLPAAAHPPAKARLRHLQSVFRQFPDEVFALVGADALGPHPELAFRASSTHLLTRDLNAASIGEAGALHRSYAAADWLCDPAGFFFIAENILGVYDIADPVPLMPGTSLHVFLPIAAKISVERDGAVVVEKNARDFRYAIREPGDYRVIASLAIDGETWPWIETNAIHIEKAAPLPLPGGQISPAVEVHRDVPYLDDGLDQHKLDLYLPKGRTNFPVMVFLHGGSWRGGDRSRYPWFGNRFALAGIGVAIPSYRLMPENPYPAQEDDAAAAFAWVHRHSGEFGGDPARIYLAGHSAGGHLASLVALDPRYLAKYGLNSRAIRGVISLSGVYNAGSLADFQNADDDPSPIDHVHGGAPRFLLTYCQWDDFELPKQARDFAAALRQKFGDVLLEYIAGENHASEILDTRKPGDGTARAILDFIR